MNRFSKSKSAAVCAAIAGSILFWTGCTAGSGGSQGHDHGHGQAEAHAEETFERGPHGGRLLEEGDFALEVTIFESGVAPEFRVYPYFEGDPVPASDVTLSVELARLGGVTDKIGFVTRDTYLGSDRAVYEPHSFVVSVKAVHADRSYYWDYEQIEGRTQIPDEAAQSAGIRASRAGPGRITETIRLQGSIEPDGNRLAHIHPRYAGLTKQVLKFSGDDVASGEALAIIESNESLSNYRVESAIAGTVIDRHLAAGEFVTNETRIFTVADLSTVWLEFLVYGPDAAKVRKGQKVVAEIAGETFESSLFHVSPVMDQATQSLIARAALPNKDGRLKPGMILSARIVVGEKEVPIAVKTEAIQGFRDWAVVFQKAGDVYEIMPVETGRSDGEWVEITEGISAGTEYVSEGSFIVKADILKLGASHDH